MSDLQSVLRNIGSRIKFEVSEGVFEGTLIKYMYNDQKVRFSDVVVLPEKLKMGNLVFRISELLSLSVVSEPKPSKNQTQKLYFEVTYNENSVQKLPTEILDENKTQKLPTEIMDENQTQKLTPKILNIVDSDEEIETDVCFDQTCELRLPPVLIKVLPNDYITINSISRDFQQAIEHISLQSIIGVSLEGSKISRNGSLSFINISTSYCLFFFDLKQLRNEAFENGLREVLENPRIEKVLHDCRLVSDSLYHMHNVKLTNVFDTQVADYISNMQLNRSPNITVHVNNLNSCLMNYLEIPQEFLVKPKPDTPFKEYASWFTLRPVQQHLMEFMVKNVIYLLLLRREVHVAMLNPFYKAVDVYLTDVRGKTDRELCLRSFSKDILPSDLVFSGIQTVKFKKNVDYSMPSLEAPIFDNKTDNYLNHTMFMPHEDAKIYSSKSSQVESSCDEISENVSNLDSLQKMSLNSEPKFSMESDPMSTSTLSSDSGDPPLNSFDDLCMPKPKLKVEDVWDKLRDIDGLNDHNAIKQLKEKFRFLPAGISVERVCSKKH